MELRKSGLSQITSAAKAGMSESSARKIEKGRYKDPREVKRKGRTRIDPFSEVWETELVGMLKSSPTLSGLTLLEYLQEKHGDAKYPNNLLRTLQRRVKVWSHLEGPGQEVVFRQRHEPGRLGLSDFTKLKGVTITIEGERFDHLLYHFRLIYSGWSYMQVVMGGESYTALANGLQKALWCIGGCPKEHRTDSLSAAFKNRLADSREDITDQYNKLCDHYKMKPSRNNKGVAHENGGIESPHGHLKRRIKQALMIRGSCDFNSIASYQSWIENVVSSHNRRNAKNVEVEKLSLLNLPEYKGVDFTSLPVVVTNSSTIVVRSSLYTVPSGLIGATLEVHLYDDRLLCYLSGELVQTLSRVYGQGKKRRARSVDYRHLIDSLAKKPMAFYYSRLRDAILPNDQYRSIWAQLDQQLEPHTASRLMVGLLALAAKADCQEKLSLDLELSLSLGNIPNLVELQNKFLARQSNPVPALLTQQHPIEQYNQLIAQGGSYGFH